MRRIGNLYSKVIEPNLLAKAAKKCCQSRKDKQEVEAFISNYTVLMDSLRQSLIDHTFQPSEYRLFKKMENGKERLVSDQPLYPDRIVHQAVAMVVEPYIDRRLIPQTHASRKGYGPHSAVANVRKYLDRDERLIYGLKMDVKQFFRSVPLSLAKKVLRRVIKDDELLELIDRILEAYGPVGLALGNRLSPMIANLILSYAVDYPLKQKKHVHYYVRFMDDMIVLGYSKQWLHSIRRFVQSQLEYIGLTLKENWQVFPISDRGVQFVGRVIYPGKTRMCTKSKKKMLRATDAIRLKQLDGVPLTKRDLGAVWSYNGCIKNCDGDGLRRISVGPIIEQLNKEREQDAEVFQKRISASKREE